MSLTASSDFPRTLADLKAGWKSFQDPTSGEVFRDEANGHNDEGAEANPDGHLPADRSFSSAPNFYSTLRSIRRANLSISHRLRSICVDAEFARDVSQAFKLPLVPNERCGTWYVPPGGLDVNEATDPGRGKTTSAVPTCVYFKSTDGHHGQWTISFRRLNLHLLDLVGKHGGCIIVDSTRRGKLFPDALAKTVPIWCAVINRLLFPALPWAHNAYPQGAETGERLGMSRWEVEQIEKRLPKMIVAFEPLIADRICKLRETLKKPVKVDWIAGHSLSSIGSNARHGGGVVGKAEQIDTVGNDDHDDNGDSHDEKPDHHCLLLCSVSRRVHGHEMAEEGYVQGAGDDSEHWGHGLTPLVFWQHKDRLLAAGEGELPGLIEQLITSDGGNSVVKGGVEKSITPPTLSRPLLIQPTENVFFAAMTACKREQRDASGGNQLHFEYNTHFDLIIQCHNIQSSSARSFTSHDASSSPCPPSVEVLTAEHQKHVNDNNRQALMLDLPIVPRLGSRALRHKLHLVRTAVENLLTMQNAQRSDGETFPVPNDTTSVNEKILVLEKNPVGSHEEQRRKRGQSEPSGPKILITALHGTDHWIGVALTILCLFYNPKGRLVNTHLVEDVIEDETSSNPPCLTSNTVSKSSKIPDDKKTKLSLARSTEEPLAQRPIDKALIRQRLTWITSNNHNNSIADDIGEGTGDDTPCASASANVGLDAGNQQWNVRELNPSRATLQSVNAFLMKRKE